MATMEEATKLLHDVECHYNHTDMCGWYYEVGPEEWTKPGGTHLRYLRRVAFLVGEADVSLDDLVRVLTALQLPGRSPNA